MKDNKQIQIQPEETISIEEIEFSDALLLDDDGATCGDYNL